jgi:hypothetical protein
VGNLNAQSAEDVQRGEAVFRRKPSGGSGLALGQRAKKENPVGNRFISRYANSAPQWSRSRSNEQGLMSHDARYGIQDAGCRITALVVL